jgi:serine/threonine protein kinase
MRIPAPRQAYDPMHIGPYQVVGRLGAGSMGQVFLARTPSSRLVAVKTIRAGLADDPTYRQRFANEVAIARRVSGAFTPAVVAADPEADLPWLATVYVPAPSLAALIEACGPLPVPAVRWLAAGCAEALECIHRAGLVHRDLKPGNVLVGMDGPRVIDFGLARVDDLPHLTKPDGVMGTPSFMAPEQASGESAVGPACDVYSLGATLLYAATGRSPYRASSGAEAIMLLMTGRPDLSEVPAGLRSMLAGCLARDPQDRPTPAALIEYHAPYLAARSNRPPLPQPALDLVEDYSRGPDLEGADSGEWDPGWEAEPEASAGSGSGRAPSAPGSGAPYDPDPDRTRGTGSGSGGGSGGGSQPQPGLSRAEGGLAVAVIPGNGTDSLAPTPVGRAARHRGGSRSPLLVGSLAVGSMLVAAGVAAGVSYAIGHAGPGPGPGPNQNFQPADGGAGGPGGGGTGAPPFAGQSPPVGPPPGSPPPDGLFGPPLGPPPSGAIDQSDGLVITIDPPSGDQYTGFVIRGAGWPPGASVTVAVAGGPVSRVKPVVDPSGVFLYQVNAEHELFAGAIPPGTYKIRVTCGALAESVMMIVYAVPGASAS